MVLTAGTVSRAESVGEAECERELDLKEALVLARASCMLMFVEFVSARAVLCTSTSTHSLLSAECAPPQLAQCREVAEHDLVL